jgi:hypothetical protein
MKSLFVVSHVPGEGGHAEAPAPSVPDRRQHQRRMGVARRTAPERREEIDVDVAAEARASGDRRAFANRRRRPDRRIGLSRDLDVYLLGI